MQTTQASINKNNQKTKLEKNNCMDILSDKQAKCHTRKLNMAKKGKPSERNGISFHSGSKTTQ